jgi:hypothetical protein
MSTILDTAAWSPRRRDLFREQLLKALQQIPTDGSTNTWSDVYVPGSHLQALNPERMVVEGMRGSGKSFWTGVLANRELRQALGNQLLGVDLKAALARITQSHAIALDLQGPATNFPNISELPGLLRLPNVTVETIWRVAILRLFTVDPLLGMPTSTDTYDVWQEPVAWAGQNAGRVERALDALDQRLVSSNETALVVFDALDRVSHDLTEVSIFTAGLLRVMLNLRFAKGLRLKAFIREDVLARAGASVVDGSKLLNNKVKLQWSEADLYGLAFYRIAQHSSSFRSQLERVTGVTIKSYAGRFECDKADEPAVQKQIWRAWVGDYMGRAATTGHSYPYIFNHLSDGLGRVAPRTFLTALRAAITAASDQYRDKQHVIHHEAIKDGVRDASAARVIELRDEYTWIDPALSCIKEQQTTVPIDSNDLEKIWLKSNCAVLQTIDAMRDRALIPWGLAATNAEKVGQLRATLEQIGIIKLRLKEGVERIELPDIYRLAYKIGRHGGISTQKKS